MITQALRITNKRITNEEEQIFVIRPFVIRRAVSLPILVQMIGVIV